MEDTHIVELYWARDEEALAQTQAKYGRYCHTIAYNILGNTEDAAECVNDAYMGAWNSIPPHRPSMLSTYLGKLTRRAAWHRWRDQSAAKRGGGQAVLALEEMEPFLQSAGSVEEEVLGQELTQALNRFVKELPQAERCVFLRRYWYLDPQERIAARYGFTVAKVNSMLYRTRTKLRKFLSKEGLL